MKVLETNELMYIQKFSTCIWSDIIFNSTDYFYIKLHGSNICTVARTLKQSMYRNFIGP